MNDLSRKLQISSRFRGYLPVVVDVETGGFNAETDALLEIAAITLQYNNKGMLDIDQTHFFNVLPFQGANLEASSLAVTKIDPYHPFRNAVSETEAIRGVFRAVRKVVHKQGCKRAILVGHNPVFDLTFIKAVCKRNEIGNNPFHPFSTMDTATLGALAFGHTVLAKAIHLAGMEWNQNEAHSALYDAQRTADLFCRVINTWNQKVGIPFVTE